MPTRSTVAALVLMLAAVLGIAACSSSGSAKAHESQGAAAASSALANPTVSSDLNAEETLLLNNLQKNFDPVHPVKSVETAVQLTFPHGNLHNIEKYAVSTFTLAVIHTKGPGSARDLWLMKVVAYAQSTQGIGSSETPATSSPSSGQANIPGLQPSPTPSTSRS